MSCTSCKKKKPIKELEPIIEEFVPTSEDIKLAYAELTSVLGVKEDKKNFINNVYHFLFGEQFEFDNPPIGRQQARKFKFYLDGK